MYQVRDELSASRRNSISNDSCIPLCVPYSEKDLVKKLGAKWCPVAKSWFCQFNERSLFETWLPLLYKRLNDDLIIEPRLVPAPLWGKNLRLHLHKSQVKALWQQTYEIYGYRCGICGCKGTKWPVECDEIWSYDVDYNKGVGMVTFEGLHSLCPGCHGVVHFGKSITNKTHISAFARFVVLNNIIPKEGDSIITHHFEEWKKMSAIDLKNWLFNYDILENDYGVFVEESEDFTKVRA